MNDTQRARGSFLDKSCILVRQAACAVSTEYDLVGFDVVVPFAPSLNWSFNVARCHMQHFVRAAVFLKVTQWGVGRTRTLQSCTQNSLCRLTAAASGPGPLHNKAGEGAFAKMPHRRSDSLRRQQCLPPYRASSGGTVLCLRF